MKSHAMTATVHVLRHLSVAAAIHLPMDIMAEDHLHLVGIALVVMNIVVVHHLHVTITTLATVDIGPRLLLVQLVPLLTILIHLLVVAMGAMILTEHLPLVVVLTMIRMAPTDMTGRGRGLHHLGHMGDTMSVHPQDTGDCSFP